MPPTTIHSAPPLDSFTPLADHQSQTPEVFYGAKPVLHYHATGARALVSRDQQSKLPIFSQRQGDVASEAAEDVQPDGLDGKMIAEVIDAYIGSE
jgi:nucleotide-sensitive chloride channel 1A